MTIRLRRCGTIFCVQEFYFPDERGGWGGGLSRSLVSLPPRKSNSAHNKINVEQFQVGNRLMLTNEAMEADFPLRIRLGCIAAHVGTDS